MLVQVGLLCFEDGDGGLSLLVLSLLRLMILLHLLFSATDSEMAQTSHDSQTSKEGARFRLARLLTVAHQQSVAV